MVSCVINKLRTRSLFIRQQAAAHSSCLRRPSQLDILLHTIVNQHVTNIKRGKCRSEYEQKKAISEVVYNREIQEGYVAMVYILLLGT
ncbi:hypothetical protein Bca4012_086120 [Brassica carinata]